MGVARKTHKGGRKKMMEGLLSRVLPPEWDLGFKFPKRIQHGPLASLSLRSWEPPHHSGDVVNLIRQPCVPTPLLGDFP